MVAVARPMTCTGCGRRPERIEAAGIFQPSKAFAEAIGDTSPRPKAIELVLCRRCFKKGMAYVEGQILARAQSRTATREGRPS